MPNPAILKPKRGTSSALANEPIEDGALLAPTDADSIMLDQGNTRKTIKSGHTMKGPAGAAITQRATVKFVDATVTDDSTNGESDVQIVRDMTQAEYDALPVADRYGLINITDAPEESGGHVIEDADDTEMTQRDTLQFGGYLKTSDDSTNEKTVVSDAPTPITWTEWNALTPAEKAGTKWLISDAPDADIDIDEQTPTFTEAATRTNIASLETISTLFGKIKKWFSDLKTVAFTGSYNDLDDKPTIPAAQVNSDWNASSGVAQILNKPSLATVATSGSYNDLSNQPTIPTNTNQLTNGAGFITSSGSITGSSGSCTGNAATATKLGTATVGSASRPIYLNAGAPTQISYTIEKSVPSNAVFTDTNTTYSAGTGISLSGTTFSNSGVRAVSINGNYLRVNTNGTNSDLTIAYATSAGNADTVDSRHLDWGSGGNVGTSVTYLAAWKNDGTLIGWVERSKISVNYAASAGAVAWGNVSSKPTFSTGATANAVAQRDGSGHLTMVDCKCAAVIKTSNDWLPICGYGAVTIRNRDNSAYIPAFASAFTVQSSRRYKENIVGMTEEDAKTLLSLRPVTFDYKEGIIDGNRTGQRGLIAEEVAEIETFPVTYNLDGEVEGLDYSKFIPQLIKLCQIQQDEIDNLKERITNLESAR